MKGLLMQCIENITVTGMQKIEVFGKRGVLINEIVENDLKNINAAFLPRKIEDERCKIFVVGCFLSVAEEREISSVQKEQIMRFTSNIIGSLRLNKKDVRVELLEALLCVGHKESPYPSLKLPGDLLSYFELSSFRTVEDINYIVYMNCTNVLTTALQEYLYYDYIPDSMLVSIDILHGLFACLFRDNNTQAVDSLFGSYFDENQRGIDANIGYVHNLYFIWFILACQRKAAHATLIQELYDHIDFNKIDYDSQTVDDVEDFFTFYEKNKKTVFNAVAGMKDKLLQKKDGESKLMELVRIFVEIRKMYIDTCRKKPLFISEEYEKEIMKTIFKKESLSSEEHSK